MLLHGHSDENAKLDQGQDPEHTSPARNPTCPLPPSSELAAALTSNTIDECWLFLFYI